MKGCRCIAVTLALGAALGTTYLKPAWNRRIIFEIRILWRRFGIEIYFELQTVIGKIMFDATAGTVSVAHRESNHIIRLRRVPDIRH